ncbi:MAG: hypothetical protein SGPRY_011736 [Prymnesium sp.]
MHVAGATHAAAFCPAGEEGPGVLMSREAADLCGMLSSAMEFTSGIAAVEVPFARMICERVAAACETIASTGELGTPALLMLLLRGAHEALELCEALELVEMSIFVEGPAALREGVCTYLASILAKCGTPEAVCAQFGIECDLTPHELHEMSTEPPWVRGSGDGCPQRAASMIVGSRQLPSDSVGEVLHQSTAQALLMLKKVSRSWGDMCRKVLCDKGWAERNQLRADWAGSAQRLEGSLALRFHEMLGREELSAPNSAIDDQHAGGLGALLVFTDQLMALDLCNNGLGDDGAACIAKALRINSSLVTLVLGSPYGGNNIGPSGAIAIADALRVNHTLTHLSLSYNDIGAEGAVALANSLSCNMALAALCVGGNDIGPAGGMALANLLQHNRVLTTLEVNENEVDDTGAAAFIDALGKNSVLTELK